MVRLKFEGRKLEDLDFWTKSDPFLILSRPARNGPGFAQVCRIVYGMGLLIIVKLIDVFF